MENIKIYKFGCRNFYVTRKVEERKHVLKTRNLDFAKICTLMTFLP